MKKAKKNHLQGSSTNQIPRLLPKKITKFEDIPAHTAKCDTCNRRNSKGMTRCGDCGWQLCQSCRQQRGGDLTHRTFSSEHTEAPEARSPVSVPEASATPEISTVSNMSPYGIEPTEEDAAEILVKIQSSSSPAVRSCSEEEESIPTPTPMPRSRGYSSRPQDRADDSDDTIFMHSSQERHEEDSPEIFLEDIVRRNPFRRARPGRNDFVQADPRVV
ncbi:hypothetical protein N7450_002666 [Penicillium hetheringtonii]|uniref:Uncharacterized protein n=1 Tax=Penicillium hetheringtonii TaxID=911720 RepID=A0AAD6DWH7_9EURO|nr:hypothetical protein N7450_002666 [Penicillium hetheringtonii]